MRSGAILYLLCPSCQTPEHNAEVVIHEATLEYRRDAFRRVMARPRSAG